MSSGLSPGALEGRLWELEELRRRGGVWAPAGGSGCASERTPAEVVVMVAAAGAITAAGIVDESGAV